MRLLLLLGMLVSLPVDADMADFFGEFFSRPAKFKKNASYRIGDLGESGADGRAFDHRWHELAFGFPVHESGDGSVWRLAHHTHVEELRTDARFPGRPVPTTLWNTGVTGMYSKDYSGERRFTAAVTTGSNADKPFYSARELSMGVRAMYRQPAAEGSKHHFLLMMDFANTRNFANWVPLPGVAWLFDLGEDYKVVAGFPFLGFFGMPAEKLMVTWFYLPPTNTMLRVGYRLFGPAQVFSHFKWNLRNWFLHDRADEYDERIYAQEKEVLLGLTMPVTGGLLAEASGGLWFDRRWWTGRGYKYRHAGRMFNVDDAAFAQMKLSYGW
ncbi:MAG: hypothetical protein HUU37_03020 [Bdellovibrionales bacterium]|nr:hypothetical protein [Bdellovibrionales bacterium]